MTLLEAIRIHLKVHANSTTANLLLQEAADEIERLQRLLDVRENTTGSPMITLNHPQYQLPIPAVLPDRPPQKNGVTC